VSDRGGVLDLRTYKLKPGAGEQFGRVLENDVLPMLDRFGIEVVGSPTCIATASAASSPTSSRG
jgi:hypothetical protein